MEFVCFVWVSEQTASFTLHNITRRVFIIKVESVYCAVRTQSLHNTYVSSLKGLRCQSGIERRFIDIWLLAACVCVIWRFPAHTVLGQLDSKFEAARSFETSVSVYQSKRLNISRVGTLDFRSACRFIAAVTTANLVSLPSAWFLQSTFIVWLR
jgi:hypothetical protein